MFLPLSIVRSLPADVPLYLDLLHGDLSLVILNGHRSSGGLDAHLPVDLAKNVVHLVIDQRHNIFSRDGCRENILSEE